MPILYIFSSVFSNLTCLGKLICSKYHRSNNIIMVKILMIIKIVMIRVHGRGRGRGMGEKKLLYVDEELQSYNCSYQTQATMFGQHSLMTNRTRR